MVISSRRTGAGNYAGILTDNNETLQISPDDHYTFISLYNDICSSIGVEPLFAIDSDYPALFDLRIELADNLLINIEEYTLPLNKLMKSFNSEIMTVYLQFILGRGEVYRGDGIKMCMIAEPGVCHNGAHVHVYGKDGRSATINIETGEAYESTLNSKENKRAKKILAENKKTLLGIWETLNVKGVSIDIDYKLKRIYFRRANMKKVCVKAVQELGLTASEESIEALELVKYGPVHEVEVISEDLIDLLLDEFNAMHPDYKYVKAELCYIGE